MRDSPQTTYNDTQERKIRHIMEGMGAFSNRSDRDDCSNVNKIPVGWCWYIHALVNPRVLIKETLGAD